MGYPFWCRHCKFDHAGECKTKIVVEVDPKSGEKAKSLIDQLQDLVKALEAGNYNAAPGVLHQCKRNPLDCDVCYPPGKFFDVDTSVDGDTLKFSARYKMAVPLTFIPITFQVAQTNDDFIRENGPIGPECFGGTDYPDFCYDCGAPTPCSVDHT